MLSGRKGVYFPVLAGEKTMRNVFWKALLLSAFSTALVAQQKPQLKKMTPSELATLTHDLQHDLANWKVRINQYRNNLNSSFKVDSIMLRYFEALDGDIDQLQANVKQLSGKDSLANDVSLYSSLESVGSGLDGISTLSADAPTAETLASSKLRDVGDTWAHTIMDVREEIRPYTMRFYAHTLASAILADLMLEVCRPDQPKKPTK